jgi:predicted metal-dependent peptidase
VCGKSVYLYQNGAVLVDQATRILEEVTRTSIELLMREPFYSHFFSTINKEVVAADHHLKTLAIGLRDRYHTLFVNAHFWDHALTHKNHRYGVLKHEVLHIVFKHTLEKVRAEHGHLTNIAMDIVVNQYIERSYLPDEGIFLEDFPELELARDQSWRYYYEKLKVLAGDLDGKFAGTKSARFFQSIRETSHGLDRHGSWAEIGSLDDIERSLLDANIDTLIHIARAKTPEKSYGSLSAGLRTHLQTILFKARPLVDWRRVVKLFSESSSKTKIRNTLKRPSRRYGTIPGIKVKGRRKLLIAIDTSISVTPQELEVFFNEIFHLWRQGTEIEVVECDVSIKSVYAFKGIAPKFVKGRGGTDFNAPIAYGNNSFHPDGLIYFTDGVAPAPKVKPRFPMLWVITKEGIASSSPEFNGLPGRKAKLN